MEPADFSAKSIRNRNLLTVPLTNTTDERKAPKNKEQKLNEMQTKEKHFQCKILYHNVQSLKHKLEEIKIKTREEKFDIISCVETWLDASHQNREIAMEGYKVIRKDRSHMPNRGGICIYINKSLKMNLLNVPDHNTCACENLWITVTNEKSKKCVIGLIYRSPSNTDFVAHIKADLEYIASLNRPVIIMGE